MSYVKTYSSVKKKKKATLKYEIHMSYKCERRTFSKAVTNKNTCHDQHFDFGALEKAFWASVGCKIIPISHKVVQKTMSLHTFSTKLKGYCFCPTDVRMKSFWSTPNHVICQSLISTVHSCTY